jgi:hypothetical protein
MVGKVNHRSRARADLQERERGDERGPLVASARGCIALRPVLVVRSVAGEDSIAS